MSYELSPREVIMNIVDLVERSSIRTDIAENLADVLKGLIVSVPKALLNGLSLYQKKRSN